jgi:GDP-L-fucose synthase
MEKDAKIYIAGHRGMVGSAIWRALSSEGYGNLVGRSSAELDLRNQHAVFSFFETEKPDYVFLAAAKVGGIVANNTYRGAFLYDNLMMEANVIEASRVHGVKKLLFLGSSCIYPKLAPQPLKEEYLLSGYLEATNEPYAIAKIAGIKLCETYWDQYGCRFIAAMPTNLYGPNDNYHPTNSHVIPGLIRKFHEAKRANAKEVEIWGTGTPLREFLHVDDLARASIFLMKEYEEKGFINVGSNDELSIAELAQLIAKVVGFEGSLVFNTDKPDGTPRKLMDNTRIFNLGWKPEVPLEVGLKLAYQDFILI